MKLRKKAGEIKPDTTAESATACKLIPACKAPWLRVTVVFHAGCANSIAVVVFSDVVVHSVHSLLAFVTSNETIYSPCICSRSCEMSSQHGGYDSLAHQIFKYCRTELCRHPVGICVLGTNTWARDRSSPSSPSSVDAAIITSTSAMNCRGITANSKSWSRLP